ncbi:MAG TPA: hypothetical protein VGD67_08270 [Pseudonocardiaceae bacterium]
MRTPGGPPSVVGATAVALWSAGWPVLASRPPRFTTLITTRPPASAAETAEWWRHEDYGIACPSAGRFDLVEVPAEVGEHMTTTGWPAPVLTLTHDTWPVAGSALWWFLVTPGSPQIQDLPRDSGIRLIRDGRWIPLPPTRSADDHTVRWAPCSGPAVPSQRDTTHPAADPDPVVVPRLPAARELPHSLAVQWTALKTWQRLRSAAFARSFRLTASPSTGDDR